MTFLNRRNRSPRLLVAGTYFVAGLGGIARVARLTVRVAVRNSFECDVYSLLDRSPVDDFPVPMRPFANNRLFFAAACHSAALTQTLLSMISLGPPGRIHVCRACAVAMQFGFTASMFGRMRRWHIWRLPAARICYSATPTTQSSEPISCTACSTRQRCAGWGRKRTMRRFTHPIFLAHPL